MKETVRILFTVFAVCVFVLSGSAFAENKIDSKVALNEEFNAIVDELIKQAEEGNVDEVKGLGSKLCRFKCDRVYDLEKTACGPGPNEGAVKKCRDNARRHRDTCKRGC